MPTWQLWSPIASGLSSTRRFLGERDIQHFGQVGAIPVRRGESGALEVLLVTSRETKRWIIPKGSPWPNCTDFESAAGEAREEAGITGSVEEIPFGAYVYAKRIEADVIETNVDVFLLWVEELLDDWPEHADRTRSWFTPDDAANAVQEVQLKAMLRTLNDLPIHRERRA